MPRADEAWLRCPDGIRLAARLWRPDGEGPWPVLLMRQPYGRAIASTVTYAHPSWYAERGFLVVVQDVRGRGDSEGDFGGFAQERADGAATVRWARRLPGADGRVGTYGFSYQGLTQLLVEEPADPRADPADPTLPSRPPADPLDDPLPDCLAPAMCGLDERLHWAGEGGAHWWALGLGWALQLAAERCRREREEAGWWEIRQALDSGAFLERGPELLERFDPAGMGLGWLRRDPAGAEGWRVHAVPEALLRRPMLLLGGWHDPHLRGVLDLWRRSRRAGGNPELHIGAWSHLDWRGGIDERQLAFFQRHLPAAGGPAAVAAGGAATRSPGTAPERLQLQCVTSGDWRPFPSAPPPPASPGPDRPWGLQSGGLAAIRSDEGRLLPGEAGEGRVCFVHDPWRPVPGRGGHLGPPPALAERSDLDGRADVVCFTAPPLEEDLELLGEPWLRIDGEADQPGFDLCATLSRVSRDGSSVRQLSSGVARFGGEHCRERRPRTVTLQPLRARLEPGESLRLSLAAAAWPQVAVNPGDGRPPWGPAGPRHRVITLTLHLTGARLWLEPPLGAN